MNLFLPKNTIPFSCPEKGCCHPCATQRQIAVEDSPYETEDGEWVCPGYCYQLMPPERFEIDYEAVQEARRAQAETVKKSGGELNEIAETTKRIEKTIGDLKAGDISGTGSANNEKQQFDPIVPGRFARQEEFSADRNKELVILKHAGKFFVSKDNNLQWRVIIALIETKDPNGYADLHEFGKWQNHFRVGKSAKIPTEGDYRGCKGAGELFRYIVKLQGKRCLYRLQKKPRKK